MNILVLGCNGMIGNAVFRVLSENTEWTVFGTVRSSSTIRYFFPEKIQSNVIYGLDLLDYDNVISVFNLVKPDVVVNCAGITKHKPQSIDPLLSIPINSLIPHRLNRLCELSNSRLIHISSDCVFSGEQGNYKDDDVPDAHDIYGKSKALGEVDSSSAVTLRTSTIGHELNTSFGLLEWFLSQEGTCKGYRKARFSGMPSVVFAEIIRDIVIPNKSLTGLYNVGAAPIDKFSLLSLIADIYKKDIRIVEDNNFFVDRSLNNEKFYNHTGYVAPSWESMIRAMLLDSLRRIKNV